MKVLNLFSGLGGNRKLWGDEHDITAVEYREDIAKFYSVQYPQDRVVVGDAHQYLLDCHSSYDFIWSSCPCPTHSRARFWSHQKDNPDFQSLPSPQPIPPANGYVEATAKTGPEDRAKTVGEICEAATSNGISIR